MKNGYKKLRECVMHNPLALSTFPVQLQRLVDSLLPYSVGFEIECSTISDNYYVTQGLARQIPNIVDVYFDDNEQRFRIPAGVEGLICLYNISEFLKEHSQLNLASGIHYHIDFQDMLYTSDMWRGFHPDKIAKENNSWILKELDTWKYTGAFNHRLVSTRKTWVRLHEGYNTMEVRIGEMTFDYKLLVKRILHCSAIAKRLKNILKSPNRTKVPKISKGVRVVGKIALA